VHLELKAQPGNPVLLPAVGAAPAAVAAAAAAAAQLVTSVLLLKVEPCSPVMLPAAEAAAQRCIGLQTGVSASCHTGPADRTGPPTPAWIQQWCNGGSSSKAVVQRQRQCGDSSSAQTAEGEKVHCKEQIMTQALGGDDSNCGPCMQCQCSSSLATYDGTRSDMAAAKHIDIKGRQRPPEGGTLTSVHPS
jgi:hypothetical protein